MLRIFDFVFALLGLVFLLPVFVIIGIWIKLDSPGSIFYLQERIGRNRIPFKLYKFRSMRPDSDKKGLLTVGGRDPRITDSGYFIRKYKIDELPQLFNVLIGEMSLVGPRPEVKKYVDLYNQQQLEVLKVRPGITDLASIIYKNENEVLANSTDPEKTYIDEIMPHKLELNRTFINNPTVSSYFNIIFRTIFG